MIEAKTSLSQHFLSFIQPDSNELHVPLPFSLVIPYYSYGTSREKLNAFKDSSLLRVMGQIKTIL